MPPIPLPARARVLVVDDDATHADYLCSALEPRFEAQHVASFERALAQLDIARPEALIIGLRVNRQDGRDFCRHLAAHPDHGDLPVLVLAGRDGGWLDVDRIEAECFEAGAVDFLRRPVSPVVAVARLTTHVTLRRTRAALERRSATDGLTLLANRAGFDAALEREWQVALREGRPLGLLLVDVDHFKSLNDLAGHPAGDERLRRIAALLSGACRRPTDFAARWGGDEFALLLPGADTTACLVIAHELLDAMRRAALPHPAHGTVTLTLGAASHRPVSGMQASALLAAADAALYRAKAAGRDRASD